MKMKLLSLLLICFVLAAPTWADSISVNFTHIGNDASGSGWGFHDTIGRSSLSLAGYAVADNWTDVWKATNTTVVTDLIDSNGNTTPASIIFNNDYSWGVYNNIDSGPGAVHDLNKNAVRIANSNFGHNSGSAEKTLLTVSGIPYSEYTAIVYLLNDGGGRTAKVTVDGTSYYYTTETGPDLEQRFFDGDEPWLVASGTTPGDYSQVANVAVFPGLTDPNCVVTFDAVSSNAGVSGIQIVEWDPADWPDPYRGQDLVNRTPELSWEPPVSFTPTGYDVYLNPDESLVAAGDSAAREAQGQPGTTFTPTSELLPDTRYFWRIDAVDPNDGDPAARPGYVMNFTTVPAVPLILTEPVSVTVAAGTDAAFEITGENFEDFQWYYSTDASNATPGDDTPVGVNSATLTVTADLSTEGWYYCVVSNTSGTDTSEVARLMTERLVGWWKLDGDLSDAVATVVAGAPTHDGTTEAPDFDAGKDAQALSLLTSQDPCDVVIINDSGDYFDFYPQGLTLSAWINTNDDGYGAYVAKQDRSGTFRGVILSHFYNNASFTERDTAGISNDVVNIRDGNWHLITGTLDPEAGVAKLYIDGKRYAGDEDSFDPSGIVLHDEPLFFGAETTDGATAPFDGLLDDVRIYSYALDPVDVALMYTDFNPGATVCVEDIGVEQGDLDGNCVVDLLDLAEFAGDWLGCMLVPTCLP